MPPSDPLLIFESAHDFSWSRSSHFDLFKARQYDLELFGCAIDPGCCDLKAYQDLLVFAFITTYATPGARILEVGGGDSRILKHFSANYECWNIDPLEGLGNGPRTVDIKGGYRLVRDFMGAFNNELPDSYFNIVFSISALEHVPSNDFQLWVNIKDDIQRVLQPEGYSLHCFDVVLKNSDAGTNPFLPFLFREVDTANSFYPLLQLAQDPDLYVLSEKGYRKFWQPLTRKPYREFGKPLSYNIMWRKPAAGPAGKSNISAGGLRLAFGTQPAAFPSWNKPAMIQKNIKDPSKKAAYPRISVITPCFNQANYLELCIDSIVGQNYPNLEYIIMDGGSTDGSVEIIKKHEKRLAYWQSRVDGGQYWAINEGFKKSSGNIMCWLNSDDMLHPNALWIVAWAFMRYPQVRWIMGRPTVWSQNGGLDYVADPLPTWSRADYIVKDYSDKVHIQQESTFWRRSLWDQAGARLSTAYSLAGDMELWSRFFRLADLYVVDAKLGGFRKHDEQKTARLLKEYNNQALRIMEQQRLWAEKNKWVPDLRAPEPIQVGSTQEIFADLGLHPLGQAPETGTFQQTDPELKKINAVLENGIRQLEENPKHIPTLLEMGALMMRLQRWEVAVTQYRHALEADPENEAEASTVSAAILKALNKLKRAGQNTPVRDLSLAFMAFYPLNEDVTRIWSSLGDTNEDKSITEIHHAASKAYQVSAIVSTYKSEEFIAECIENLESQSIAGEIEIVIVDAASPENERGIVQTYRKRFDNITYIRTKSRIGVYAAWNIAIAHATGEYCISVSTNDQLRRDTCELLARELDAHSETVLVFGDTYLTRNSHETFERNSHYDVYQWADYSFETHLKDKCSVGPHPMWRRSIHATVGYFDERFVADGDQEFWMRLGSQFEVRHIKEFTGLQWITEASLSGKRMTPHLELACIQALYRQRRKKENANQNEGSSGAPVGGPTRHINDGQPHEAEPVLISAIVSTYNAEEFIRGCLEDLLAQSIADRMEIIVVNSGSEQNEGAVVREFQSSGHAVRYVRTDQRESVYAAWNRGIKIAKGKYITSANTDDRHRRDALEQMVGVMEARPEIDLVYADVIKTRTPHETFEKCTPTGALCWPDWDRRRLLLEGCFIGPQPVWRRAVHDTYGYFDERYTISGDYEFWLRISQTSRFYHIPTPLGLYLEHDGSLEHRNPEEKRRQDVAIALKYRFAGKEDDAGAQDDQRMNSPSSNSSESPIQGDRWTQTNSIQGGISMLTPETILAAVCRLADNDHADVAAWALDKLLEDYSNHAAAHNNRAVLAYKQGDQVAALKHYERAVELAPENASFQKDLGNFLVFQQQPEKALHRFEHVLSLKDDDIETLMASGHLSVSLQRFDDAFRYYQRVLSLDPGNVEARMFSEKIGKQKSEPVHMATPDELYAAAVEKANAGLTAEAMELLLKIVAQDKNHAVAHNDLGVLFYRQENMSQALYHYEKAAALVPENSIFQKNLADFYWIEKGDLKAAMERYVRALSLDPRDVEALLCCGRICMQLQKVEDARFFFNSVLENDPWNENARQLLQQLSAPAGASQPSQDTDTIEQQSINKPEQDGNQSAIDELEQRVGRDPLNAEAFNDLGVLYYQQGEKRKALDCYEKAVQLAPDHPVYQKNLADYYLIEEGRIKDALQLYVKVLEANPEDVECMLATGIVCVKMNNFNEARSFYERALEIEPWNADARQALAQLDQLTSDGAQPVKISYAAG